MRYCALQDVPSFLQETTTVKGQLTYASTDLKAKCRVPPGLDVHDDVTIAGMERLISLEDMAARGQKIERVKTSDSSIARCVALAADVLSACECAWRSLPLREMCLARQRRIVLYHVQLRMPAAPRTLRLSHNFLSSYNLATKGAAVGQAMAR